MLENVARKTTASTQNELAHPLGTSSARGRQVAEKNRLRGPKTQLKWVFYRTATGQSPVEDALSAPLNRGGLTRDQKAALVDAMKRYAKGESLPREVGHLVGDIIELRVHVGTCAMRLHFARRRRARDSVALALLVVNKKSQKARPQDLELSQRRLRDWDRREGAGRSPMAGGPSRPRLQ